MEPPQHGVRERIEQIGVTMEARAPYAAAARQAASRGPCRSGNLMPAATFYASASRIGVPDASTMRMGRPMLDMFCFR